MSEKHKIKRLLQAILLVTLSTIGAIGVGVGLFWFKHNVIVEFSDLQVTSVIAALVFMGLTFTAYKGLK